MEIDAGGKTPIVLPDDIYGILGIRTWNVKDSSRYLQSLFAGHEWTGAVQRSPTPTVLPGQHGFYAYRLASRLDLNYFCSTLSTSALFPNSRIQVHGLVELRGRVIEHDDGIVRGEWCRILCFFLPVPACSGNVPSDMRERIKEAGWLKSVLGNYGVPVYLTDAFRFAAVYEKLLNFDRTRADQPVPVDYIEFRPPIVKRVDELLEQAGTVGFHIPHIYVNREQMKEFKEATFPDIPPDETPIRYNSVRISCTYFATDETPYLTVDTRNAG